MRLGVVTVAAGAMLLSAAAPAAARSPAPVPSDRPTDTTKHFLIYAQAGATPRQAQQVGKLAERAFERVTASLGHAPAQPVIILAYGRPAGFVGEGAPPHAIGTVTTPSNLVRIDLWRSQDDLYQVVAHEFAHVVVARALRSRLERCPLWFNEGVATWVSQRWTPDDEAEVRDLVQAGRALTPPGLDAAFGGSGGDSDLRAAYLQSAAMVEYLTRAAGTETIARLLDAMRRSPDFDAALRQTVGLTESQLYRRWLADNSGRQQSLRWGRISPDLALFSAAAVLCIVVGLRMWRRRRSDRREDDAERLTPGEIERAREIEDYRRRRRRDD
jgi:hypothetical protein